MNLQGRLDLGRIAAPGAVPGDTLVWDGTRFKPGISGDGDHAGMALLTTQVGAGAVASDTGATALGCNAEATNQGAVAIGTASSATASGGTAVGTDAEATGSESTAVGHNAQAVFGADTTALGSSAGASGAKSMALGRLSVAGGDRATAIGYAAENYVNDRCLVKNNDLELVRSDGTGATSFILADTAGVRWRIGVDTSGNPIGLGAA